MSAQVISHLVEQLVRVETLDAGHFTRQLGAALRPTDDNAHWQFYAFDLPGGLLAGGELRLARTGDKALLSLQPREPANLTEADLDLARWGAVQNIDINPRIPPEGADAYIYLVNGVRVAFQLTHATRRVRSIALHYGVSQSQAAEP